MTAVYHFLKNSVSFLAFLVYMLIHEDFKNYIKKAGRNSKKHADSLAVLGNGPSLAKVLETWERNEDITDSDVAVVNFFCDDERFEKIRPEYYVLSDPMFFDTQCPLFEKGSAVFDVLNKKVTWEMYLYVPYHSLKLIDYQKFLHNENIIVIPFHRRLYEGFERFRFSFYKRGLGSGEYGTVVLNAEFIALNLQYKTMYMYGIDHTFFDGIEVSEKNELCTVSSHFYEAQIERKPVMHHFAHELRNMTMTEFLLSKYMIFKGHEDLQRFADCIGSRIYNCTEGSLVDAYPRKKALWSNCNDSFGPCFSSASR